MKKIVVSLVLVSTAVLAVQAQDPKARMRKLHPLMQEKLKFSEEQKQKMKAMNEDFRKNLMDLRKKDDITVKEWKNRMESLHKKHREDIRELLSNDQKAQIEKMKLERKKIAEINARAGMEKMKLRLGLSDDQAAKLGKQRTELMQKMEILHENRAFDREKKREEMKSLMKKQKEDRKSILTEEQLKKIEEMKKHHSRKKGQLS